MSSRTQGKEAARARAAAMREQQQRAERRRRALLGAGAVGVVLLVVVVLVVAKLAGAGSDSGSTSTATSGALPASIARDVTSVPAATLDAVKTGTVQAAPKAIEAPSLTADGKPRVLYVGAEYCPFCAAERWPLVVALSRFGTWSDLGAAQSATKDVYPETKTLSFSGASYTSDFLSFTGVETTTSTPNSSGTGYTPLDKLTAADQKLFDTYNAPPFVEQAGAIPFMTLGNKFVMVGASYKPEVLQGKSRGAIASSLADPKSDIGKAVGGSANVLTAALCTLTDQKPAEVCTSAGVTAAAAKVAAP